MPWTEKANSSISDFSSDNEEDGSYRQRSRTPPSESFLYDEDYHHGHRNRSSSSKGLGNDAISRALKQISRSPFTCRIEEGRLPQRFTQPSSSCTMVVQILWNTWVTSTREWLCTLRKRLWCAKCSPPV